MSDWFDRVTGTNDYERQSWRDSYNDGEAAGDWTGNVNARLESERDNFQGATWSGSSSEYSALELAQLRGAAPDRPTQLVAGLSSGNASAGNVPRSSYAPGTSRGSVASALMSSGGAWGNHSPAKLQDLVFGGALMQANPGYSNAGDGEERWGEIGGELVGLAAMGSDLGHNAARMYFGENYRDLGPAQRLSILGNDVMGAAATGAEGALAAVFAGGAALLQFRDEQHAIGNARVQLEREIEEGWALRDQLQAEEAKYLEYRRDVMSRGGTP